MNTWTKILFTKLFCTSRKYIAFCNGVWVDTNVQRTKSQDMTATYQMFIFILSLNYNKCQSILSGLSDQQKRSSSVKKKTEKSQLWSTLVWHKCKHSNESVPTLHTQLPVCHFEWPSLKRNRKPRVALIAHSSSSQLNRRAP